MHHFSRFFFIFDKFPATNAFNICVPFKREKNTCLNYCEFDLEGDLVGVTYEQKKLIQFGFKDNDKSHRATKPRKLLRTRVNVICDRYISLIRHNIIFRITKKNLTPGGRYYAFIVYVFLRD